MTTATILLDLGLAAGTTALVTIAMFVIPNIERIRFRGPRAARPESPSDERATGNGTPTRAVKQLRYLALIRERRR
jgi:hypothetical protein